VTPVMDSSMSESDLGWRRGDTGNKGGGRAGPGVGMAAGASPLCRPMDYYRR
jgi:hypothetical protein